MISLFHKVCHECSEAVTKRYSTSFSSAIKLLHKDLRAPIFDIYGFVRFADEIVDSFHEYDKMTLLSEFKTETFKAIENRISLNPILHSFQQTVHHFNINQELIHAFFNSMETDLHRSVYSQKQFEEYIYGSAEVVGLMCLYVFCEGDKDKFEELEPYAKALGAAFQKINFLRDSKADYQQLNRTYFPGVDFNNFNRHSKKLIEEDIEKDLEMAYKVIMKLPLAVRYGVYLAYKYYLSLFKKIRKTAADELLEKRIRVPDYEKAFIFLRTGVKSQLKLI